MRNNGFSRIVARRVAYFTAGNIIAVGVWYIKQIVETKLAYRHYQEMRKFM